MIEINDIAEVARRLRQDAPLTLREQHDLAAALTGALDGLTRQAGVPKDDDALSVFDPADFGIPPEAIERAERCFKKGERLREIRMGSGLDIVFMSECLGVDPTDLDLFERGAHEDEPSERLMTSAEGLARTVARR